MLVEIIRIAERGGLAMDSRGLGGGPKRTYYRQTPVTAFDWSFLMTVIGVTLVLVEVLIFTGLIDSIL